MQKALIINNKVVAKSTGGSVGGSSVVTGVPPLTISNATAQNLQAYSVYGNTEQEGLLPSGYTRLEYIQSSGTQYIDTGISTVFGTRFKFKFKNNAEHDYSYGNNSSANEILGWTYSGSYYFLGNNSNLSPTPSLNNIYDVDIDLISGASTMDISGYSQIVGSSSTIGNTGNWILFALNNRGSVGRFANQNYYSFEAYQNGTLVRSLLPACRKSDSALGMYDTVSNTFFTNAGTGTFTAGPEISPSPTNPIEVKGVGNSGLPSGYKKLEYLQSDSTTWIESSIPANTITKMEANIYEYNHSGTSWIVGRYDSATSCLDIAIEKSSAGKIIGDMGSLAGRIASPITGTSGFHDCILDITNRTFTIDGNLIGTIPEGGSLPTSNIGLIGAYYNGAFRGPDLQYKFVKVWTNNATYNLIPAKRNSNGELGMYDTVNNVFYTNSGTGTFIAGPEDTSYVVPVKVSDGINETTYNINLPTPLQKISTYADSIEGDGTLTREVGVKVLDGTDNWEVLTEGSKKIAYIANARTSWGCISSISAANALTKCTHAVASTTSDFGFRWDADFNIDFITTISGVTDLATWKAWLTAQYAAGTPVTIYYPLAAATETSVQVPSIAIQNGTNIIDVETEVTPSNMSVTYQSGGTSIKVILVEE